VTGRPGPTDGPLSPLAKGRLAGEIVASYVRVRWLLRRGGLPATVDALRGGENRAASRRPPDRAAHVTGIFLGRAVARTLRLLPADSRCLMRSLVLTSLLARRGIASSLVIAVRPAGDFAAHAWVEYEGRPLLPTGLSPSGTSPFERLVEV
jgi:hypothetical protein